MGSNKQYFVSVIIPVLNGEKYIEKCLESILNIDYPAGLYEVIVVDNGSTDKSIEIVKKYNIKILVKKNVHVSSVRNYGVEHSKGELLAFVDSDCMVSRNWMTNALPYLMQEEVGMVGSLCRAPADCNWVGKAWDICYEKRRFRGETDRLGSGNMIIKRECFTQLNGFNDNLITGEDDDICHRLRKIGYKIYSDPDITAHHFGECKSLVKFFKVEVWRGIETFGLFVETKGKMNLKITIYALFYLFSILCIFLSALYVFISQKGYILLILSIALVLTFPFYIAIRTAIKSSNWKYILHFALLYLTLGIARALALLKLKVSH